MRQVGWKCCFLLTMVLAALPLFAQQSPAPLVTPSSTGNSRAAARVTAQSSKAVNEKLAELEQRTAEAESHADNAWMLVSAALVLMMTGPGLALFYGGLVRRKKDRKSVV